MKITIHKKFHPWYYSYFLQGLQQLNIPFSFDTLINSSTEQRLNREGFSKDFLILSIRKNGKEKILVIGADDKTTVSLELLALADLYAKTNVSVETQQSHSIVPIGPTFGVKYLDVELLKMAIRDAFNKDYSKWKLAMKRVKYDMYLQLKDSPGDLRRIFYLNYPWKKHNDLTEFRKSIIEYLKELDHNNIIKFEGGFSKRRFGYHEGLREVSASKIYNHKNYLESLAQTKIALNTSAVHNCLGWKMGEFLCLGRCMLSFSIENVMPFDFKSGRHYHQIEHISELESNIKYLINNPSVVNTIQRNAHDYFHQYIAPSQIMKRLLYMV
ncbi:hypothetical protein [Lewinella sp. IMCC34191]|uniref:hypothetical protein n=1 Tax=Lewinella sp. IMCC34191 TaxID=2259172 RepID=UPI000E243996|nr:hypothetical protein [Lewinella sp. IMCC34191]